MRLGHDIGNWRDYDFTPLKETDEDKRTEEEKPIAAVSDRSNNLLRRKRKANRNSLLRARAFANRRQHLER
jgi:hypothetical protein